MHSNLRPPEPRQRLAASGLYRFNYDGMVGHAKFEVAERYPLP